MLMRCLQLSQVYKNRIYRFLYLNTYSILLQVIAVVVFLLSIVLKQIVIGVLLVIVSLLLILSSFFVFSKYNEKVIKINKAINFYYKEGLVIDYFKYFLVDPCSVLVLKYILKIIHQEKYFLQIKKEGNNYYKV